MKSFLKLVLLFIFSMSLLLQTGCWDMKVYENIGFILQVGLESAENEELLYTVTVPLVAPEAKEDLEIISKTAKLLREGREKVRLVSGKSVEGGKVQHIFFSKELAQKGISQYLEVFFRNPENPLLSNIIVVDGSPAELMNMSAKFKDKPRPAFYVNDLLVDARQSSHTPETRSFHFVTHVESKTIDPVATLVRFNEDEIRIAGTALFNGDRMTGELDANDTGLLLAMMGRFKHTDYTYKGFGIEAGEDEITGRAALRLRSVKRDIKINTDKATPQISIKLDYKSILSEYKGPNRLDEINYQKRLESIIAASFKERCIEVLKYLQELGSDPIGFQEILRSKHNRYWKKINWQEVYKDIEFDVHVKINIEFYGAMH